MAVSTGRTAALGWVDQRRLWADHVGAAVAFARGGKPPDGGAALQTQDFRKADARAGQRNRLDPAQIHHAGSMQWMSQNCHNFGVGQQAL